MPCSRSGAVLRLRAIHIRAKSIRQTTRLIELADARGYRVSAPRDSERRGGTVAFDVPHAREVSEALLANDILVDYRPNAGIRIAPHFYTTDAELERAVAMIDDILASGSWRAHAHDSQAQHPGMPG